MITRPYRARTAQSGIVLISCLLLLLVVTLIALSMFRSVGIQEKIAGNMREKQRALQAAISAQQYAEYWLSIGNASAADSTCGGLQNANLNQVLICSNQLPLFVDTGVTTIPWTIGGVPVGTYVLPANLPVAMSMQISTNPASGTVANPTYYGKPTFYISDMGTSADPNVPGEIYQVDAFAYGGTSNTAAEVESTYAVYTSSSNRTL
jgi:type IV pilus assembly protein PilX